MRFETHSKHGRVVADLYEETFGPRPDLSRTMGSKEEADKIKRDVVPCFERRKK
jgi:hypothetical protein